MGVSSFLVPLLTIVPAGLYGTVQTLRAMAYKAGLRTRQRAPVPVISVGNLALGGSGKTPFVVYLAEMMLHRGLKPAVVSRGYKGSNRASHLVVGDGLSKEPLVDSSVSGDEPFLIATRLPRVPVLVGRKRIYPVTAAHRLFACDAVILDDGFQHLQLHRDADIVLLTGAEDRMFPLGRLREPLSALKRAEMIMMVGPERALPVRASRYVANIPVFRCIQVPLAIYRPGWEAQPEYFTGQEVVLVSGIANPKRFRATAEDLGWKVIDHLAFPDHYRLTDNEFRSVLSRNPDVPVVVTEKDWVKLSAWVIDSGRVYALKIGTRMDDEHAFWNLLKRLVWHRYEKRAETGPICANVHRADHRNER